MVWNGFDSLPSGVEQIMLPCLRLLKTHGSTLLSILKTPILDDLLISFDFMVATTGQTVQFTV